MLNSLSAWHKTKLGLLAFCLAELVLAYAFASLSIDRGNLLWYLLALTFLIGGTQNLVKLIGRLTHGREVRSVTREQ